MASTLCFSLILLFSSLSLTSSQSQYALPDHYFINCGSNSNTDFNGRLFIGDENPSNFNVSGGRSVKNSNNPGSDIYQTARVFTQRSKYELQADENSKIVMLRFHFAAFSSNDFELLKSKFDVSVSGFSLLLNFNVGEKPVAKEFIIPIGTERKFTIEFTPSDDSKYAFVNAIEAFTTPSDLLPEYVEFHISPTTRNTGNSVKKLATDYAFTPIHRINVGGNPIEITGDNLRRNWKPDDSFILENRASINISLRIGLQINYTKGGAAPYHAPDAVYRTARRLIVDSVNVTWIFPVNKNRMFFVRAHFCDIVSKIPSDQSKAFYFFIYSSYRHIVEPVKRVGEIRAPFYNDFVVDSDESGFMNISIGAIRDNDQPVLLNGVEIMELIKNPRVVNLQNGGRKKSKNVYILIGCVLGVSALVFGFLVSGFLIGSRYGKVSPTKPDSQMAPSYGRSSYTSINIDFTINQMSPSHLNLNLRIPFSDILLATNNFDEKLLIGRGVFGKVYKGTLGDGIKVAVKRRETGHGQGQPEFVKEITVLSRIRHRHLVSLIGYCDEKSEMILVYEFMEKGTLQDHLYGRKDENPKLSWEKRLEICISVARGLHYLHTALAWGIIHRDIKSTNILLNEQYVAKVADFGISRLDDMDESRISDVKGSFGYLDPEYINYMALTQKSDVYSFGVVLLEVLCARPALDHNLPRIETNLADWAITEIKNGKIETIIDPFLKGTIQRNSLRKFLETVEKCLKDSGEERPAMIDVLWDLEYVLKLQQMSEKEAYDHSTIMNSLMQLSVSMIHRLPSHIIDDSRVDDGSVSSFPSESRVFSQLKTDEAR